MNQKLILKIVFCLVFIFCTASFAAEKTYNFSYSGILKDAEGNLITGNKTITFHIGSWSETQNITITEGIYSTLLGIQTPLTKDVFEESDFLLEIMIDGESLKPDTEILPVPKSILADKAKDTEKISGHPVSTQTPANNQVLRWNSTLNQWEPGTINTSPTGIAGGDLSGEYPEPTVAKIQNKPVADTSPLNGQVLKFDGSNSDYTLKS